MVCAATLRNDYSNFENIIQFVETYRLNGATWLTFYVLSASGMVKEILDFYEKREKIVEKVGFPYCSQYNFCQTTRLNDCLYRNIGRAVFISFVDVDEHIFSTDENKTFLQSLKEIHIKLQIHEFLLGCRYDHEHR